MKNQHRFFRLLLLISICFLFQFCDTEEEVNDPPVENPEISFEEEIKGTWKGRDYYIKYFDEDGEVLFTDHLNVFIDKIILDGTIITYDYKNSSPDWRNEYSTRTENDENFVVFPNPYPEMHVIELTENSMIWEETTDGGVFDDDLGNIQVQADHQVRTLKFNR